MRRRPRGLTETAPQPRVPFAGGPRQALAGALVVPGTQTRPAGQALGRGKLFHVHSDLGHQIGGGDLLNAGNRGNSNFERNDAIPVLISAGSKIALSPAAPSTEDVIAEYYNALRDRPKMNFRT